MDPRDAADDDPATVDLGPRSTIEDAAAEPTRTVVVPAPPEQAAGDGDADAFETPASATPTSKTAGDVHYQPTKQLAGRPKRASTGAPSGLSRYTPLSTTSPVEAMRHDELERLRVFVKVVLLLCLGGIIVAWSSTGDPIARKVVLIGTAGSIIGATWVLLTTRDPTRYGPTTMLGPGLLIVFGSMAGVYYWGVVSPVSAMIVYGIYFFSLGSHRALVVGMYTLVAVIHGALGLLIAFDVLADHGIVAMSSLRLVDRIALVAMVEFLYFVAFFTARVSQRVTLDAMTKLEQAARSVAQRDALLAEARADLDRALKIGGPGRYSDQQVGQFKLGNLIGRGGMGEVYEARGVVNHGEAAVKLLHPSTLTDPVQVARFVREAETSAKLDCDNVVRVLEVGTTTGQIPFIAMERLRGHDLAHTLRRHRKIKLGEAAQFANQVAAGLEAAREAGIVHRDLKPHNVFHSEQPDGTRVWKILDFGVSKHGSSGTLTKGHVVGTPAYMAPEQARGDSVDHRADVYSLAAILYRAVTGNPAFASRDVPSMLYDVVYRVPTQPSLLAHLPSDIDRVLAIGLAKDPRDRFATASELAVWFATASLERLDGEQRRRGDDVIARYAWGTRPSVSP